MRGLARTDRIAPRVPLGLVAASGCLLFTLLVHASEPSRARVTLSLEDGTTCTCDKPPDRIVVRIEVPGRPPVVVEESEARCREGSEFAPPAAELATTCYCAGAGLDVWVRRRGNELLVERVFYSEDSEGWPRPRVLARARVPRSTAVDFVREDHRTPNRSTCSLPEDTSGG